MPAQDMKVDDSKLRQGGNSGKASKVVVATGVSTTFANSNSRITTTLTPAGALEVGDKIRIEGSAQSGNNTDTEVTALGSGTFDVAATLTDASSETSVQITRLPRG